MSANAVVLELCIADTPVDLVASQGEMTSLWYTRPASVWQEALPIGNGRLGAMVFGGTRRERIQLNEDTLWAGGPYSPANPGAHEHLGEIQRLIFDQQYDGADTLGQTSFLGIPRRQLAYQTVGDLYIEMGGVPEVIPTRYRRELSLDSAAVSVEYEVNGVTFTRKYVASPAQQVIAVSLTASRPGAIDLNIFANSPQAQTSIAFENGCDLVMTGKNSPENGLAGALAFEARFRVQATSGTVTTGNDQVFVRHASNVTILIAMATSFVRYDNVGGNPRSSNIAHLDKCQDIAFEDLARQAIADHRVLFDRVRLDLISPPGPARPTDERLRLFAEGGEDPALIALYFQFGRYLLITSSRPGSQPANLQGIWNDSLDPGWGCGYTININTQMNYWPAESTNLPEMVQPLIELLQDLAQTGSITAKVMYDAEGWVCHQNTDLWRATAPNTGARWSLWPTGGAWLCRHLWDHYDYGRDLDYLRSIYPVLVGACRFFLSTMIKDPHSGFMVTNPSCSPENIHGIKGSDTTLCAGPTMDMQIIRDLLTHTIQASTILATDKVLRSELAQLRQQLRPTSIGEDGRVNEWPDHLEITEPERDHRHTSHLFGLYPSSQIDVDKTPDLAKACAVTLDQRGKAGTGWAAGWRLNLWARLQDGAKSWEMLRTLLCNMTYPNMFDVHPPLSKAYALGTFQIDGNFGGTAGIVEMIVQSPADADEVRLLPALPTQLAAGRLQGIRLRGCWTVDIEWEASTVVRVVFVAQAEGEKRVRFGTAERFVRLDKGQKAELNGRDLVLASLGS